MGGYYSSNFYQWDASAQAAYLGVNKTNSTNDAFISYDDGRACQAKVNYARNKGLGGIAIWELGQDHTPNTPDPLLQATKQAVAATSPAQSQRDSRDASLPVTGIGGVPPINDDSGITNQARHFSQTQPPP
jgi:GH18 family chitinase